MLKNDMISLYRFMISLNFKEWLVTSLFYEIQEAVLHFGAHKNKDLSDRSIPANYLQWAYENLTQLNPAFRQEIKAEIDRRNAAAKAKPAAPKPSIAVTPVTSTPPPIAQQPKQSKTWYKAKVIATSPAAQGLQIGQDVAISKTPDGQYDFVTTDGRIRGTLSTDAATNTFKTYKDAANNLIKTEEPSSAPEEPTAPAETQKKPKILSDEVLDKGAAPGQKTEGRKIDDQFKENLTNPGQSHIMISALAGTGKTTTLKHLAWKYGRPGQKWLYLVFNTKNRVEAKEDFPSFVEVHTTNSFLGKMLKDRENVSRLPQTDLMAKMKNEDNDKIVEKCRIIADSPQFANIIRQAGIPSAQDAAAEGNDKYEQAALKGIVNSINYTFKEATLTLLNLAKSYAVDPKNQANMKERLEYILGDYDIDTYMEDVKERIQKYSPFFATKIKAHLQNLFSYDFMSKDYKEEIAGAATWMLHETLPNNTSIKHTNNGVDFNLGQFRDFNDDLWFAAIHADQLNWPHYDVVLADEVQDFNEAQKIMLKKLHESGAKIVAVGDKNQAIYRFRGADESAFENIGNMLTDLSQNKNVQHTLSKNFRSRKNIIDDINASTHVNNLMQGKEFKEEDQNVKHGKVTNGEIKYGESFDQLAQEKTAGKIKETAYIARTNAPLVHAALSLLGRGIPFVIIGRDVSGDLMKHIGRIMKTANINDNNSVTNLRDNLQKHLETEKDKFSTHATKKVYLKELDDTTMALVSAIHQFAPNLNPENPSPQAGGQQQGLSVAAFKRWLKGKLGGYDVQDDEQDLKAYRDRVKAENPVILTTAHKSKGLEFERVYILRSDEFPHPRAKRPADLKQEDNAWYVTKSRAKDESHTLNLEGQPGYKK